MKKIVKENIIKNIIVVIVLIFLFYSINNYLINSRLVSDKSASGNILIATSIIAVIACFGNFGFTYEKIDIKGCFSKYLGHLTTALLMLTIGVSLIFTSILISFIMGKFILVNISLALLYIACVGYDIWDVLRIK